MIEKNFEMGYDILGRRIVLDEHGKYVTHIPCNLSEKEVLTRLQSGISVHFDARNQGMQNIAEAKVDESIEVEVAPREEWPVFYAWYINWLEDWNDEDTRNFDEFRRDFLAKGLSPEQEWQIIEVWKKQKRINPQEQKRFDAFREEYICTIFQDNISDVKGISKANALTKKR